MKLALVIGHGPEVDHGAWNPRYRVNELEYNRDLAKKILEGFHGSPIDCHLVHREQERVQPVRAVNALAPDICVELHCNAYDGLASGSEMIIYPGSTKGRVLGKYLLDAATAALRLKDRGVKEPQGNGRGMALLRGTRCPTVLHEPFFIDNDRDLQAGIEHKAKLARGFVSAVIAYAQAAGHTAAMSPKFKDGQRVKTPHGEGVISGNWVSETCGERKYSVEFNSGVVPVMTFLEHELAPS
jgi:N-acetylmuramoyl-L-alanine amidase